MAQGLVAIAANAGNIINKPVVFPVGEFIGRPFVKLQSEIQYDQYCWSAVNVTATGFTLHGYGNGANEQAGNVAWSAQ